MFGALDKYIRSLTEDEIEQHRLTEQQILRRAHTAAEARTFEVSNTYNEIVNLIEDDDTDIADNYSNALLCNGLLRHLYM